MLGIEVILDLAWGSGGSILDLCWGHAESGSGQAWASQGKGYEYSNGLDDFDVFALG